MNRHPTHQRIFPILAVLLVGAASALAQEAPDAATQGKEEVVHLDKFEVTGSTMPYAAPVARSGLKMDAPLRDIPQTINVVPAELFHDQGANSLQDVLRNVPGIGFSDGDGQRDQVTIRGFTAIADRFVDGVRDDALYYRDLANVEQVEVIKGPAAVLYGRGSSGGLINRITKKPQLAPFYRFTARVGSSDMKRAEADLNQPFGKAQFRLNASWEDSGSFRQQLFTKRHLIAPSLALALTPETTLLFQMEELRDSRITDFGIPAINGKPADVPVETYYGSANARDDDFVKSHVNAGTITLNHRFAPATALRSTLRFTGYELDRYNTVVTAVVTAGPVPMLTRRNSFILRDERAVFSQTDFTTELKTGPLTHQLLVGMEFSRQDKDASSGNRTPAPAGITLYNPVLVPLGARTYVTTADSTGLSTVAALYAQDLVKFSERWKALLGVRYDYYKQTVDDRIAKAVYGRIDREFSPRVGLVYQPAAWASTYASVTQSFQPSQESFNLAANSAGIDPEQTRNFEVGAKFDFLKNTLSLTTSVFRLMRDGIKVVDPADATKLIPVGEQQTDGFEFTLAGRPAPGWDVVAGYSYLDGRIVKSTARVGGVLVQGNHSSLTPRHSANLWVTRRLGHYFRLGAGVVYMDDRFASPSNLVTLEAYTRADASLSYVAKRYEIQLVVKNLADLRYFESAHGGADLYNTPGSPRVIEITLRTRF